MLASFADGTFESAQGRVPKMLGEEEFHASLGAAWYRRLAESGGEARDLLVAATGTLLPPTLAWLGADDEAARAMVTAGVIGPAADRLGAYRDQVRDLVGHAGIDIDAVESDGVWDASRGRTAGRPDEDAVERARGDKNRALFVE
jgi:1,2-phenylacetyl-CoA epoxidase catalytic subunit